MKIRNIGAWKAVAVVVLLTAIVCWGCRDNKPLVYSTILEAAEKGDLVDVKRHLNRGADLNCKDEKGKTPMHWAARGDYKNIIALLIAKGADVNAKDKDGWTPLHESTHLSNKDVAELMIAKVPGVQVDTSGRAKLLGAEELSNKAVAELLISKGADVNAKDNDGRTPLFWAVLSGNKDVAELLKKHGAK